MTRVAALSIIALSACTPEPHVPAGPSFSAPPAGEAVEVLWRTSLTQQATGVATDGEQLVVIHPGMAATILHPLTGVIEEQRSIEVEQATDLASAGPNSWVMTVPGDGLLLDLEQGSVQQHFCYEPGFMDVSMWEETDAVAVDTADPGVIYAVPQTFQDGQAIASAVGVWDLAEGGEPIDWYTLPWPSFRPGGMVVDDPGVLLFGLGTQLLSYPLGGEVTGYLELDGLIDQPIRGLSKGDADTLYVLTDTEVIHIGSWR